MATKRKRAGKSSEKSAPARRKSRSPQTTRARVRAAVDDGDSTIAWQQAFSLTTEATETALRNGENAALLEDYFGTEQYNELRRLAQDASSRRVRGGPRVFILPGILGSTIGVERFGPFDDVYWFDPIDVARGYLADLALPAAGGKKFTALGVILFAYMKLKLSIQLAGYEAEFFPFDWRQPIADSAQKLLDRLSTEPGDVRLVAHSMGGLVARAAMALKTKASAKIRQLIMLGTPNHGSFAPVQAFRGTYGTVVKVGRLDQKHDTDWLARNVFNTFPGLYQMLPARAVFSAIDLYNAATWTADKPQPRQPILNGVAAAHASFAPGDDRMVMIAGIGQSTTVDVRIENETFTYGLSDAGDGTVPLSFALLDGVRKTYYVEENHGSLPNNSRVERAVADLLDHGETKELLTEWSPSRGPMKWVPEDELRTGPFREAEQGALSQREIRGLLSEFAAPDSTEVIQRPLGPQESAVPAASFGHRLDHVVVTREKAQRLDVHFAFGSITDVPARAYVVGVFQDVTPSGAAHAIDEQMSGAVTDLTTRRMFSGRVGEVFIMPSGRDGLRAEMVAFVGLGAFDRFNYEVQQIAAENVIRMFARANIEEFATVLFGAGSGSGVGPALRSLLTGFLRGLKDADPGRRFRRLILCESNEAAYYQMKEELFRLSSTELCSDIELIFDELTVKASQPPVRAGVVPPTADQPVYLLIRQEPDLAARGKNRKLVHASLLTAGGKASVITESLTFDEEKWMELKGRIEGAFKEADLPQFGATIAELMVPAGIRTVMKKLSSQHLVVVHDAESARVPWELLYIDPWFPAADKGLSHRFVAENLSVAKWLEERRLDQTLRVLLIADPTENLPGARKEFERITALTKQLGGVVLESYLGPQATRPAVLSALRSGRFDVVHYAGHAFFDERDPKSSGILCHDSVVLSGADLIGVGKLPALMFFNACEAAKVRGGGAVTREEHTARSTGLAEAFLRGGVANFVGTYWPVGDDSAKEFSSAFYESLFGGLTIGDAVQKARAAVRSLESSEKRDWADYVHYGNADFVLKVRR